MRVWTKVATVAVLAASVSLAVQGSAQGASTTWRKIDCAPFPHHHHAQVCAYRDTHNQAHVEGRFFNDSTADLRNGGGFAFSEGAIYNCGITVTPAKSVSTCSTIIKGPQALFVYDTIGRRGNYDRGRTSLFEVK